MRKTLTASVIAAAAILAALGPARAADSVAPATLSITNFRGEAVSSCSAQQFFWGTNLLLTNCACYTGSSTSSARQGLDGVIVEVRLGYASTNIASTVYTGLVATTTSNWSCNIVVPSRDDPYLQVKLIDGAGSTYIYNWKTLNTKRAL